MKRLTSGFPLLFVHGALAICIDDLHAQQQRLELLVILMLGKDMMEFFLVYRVQGVFSSETTVERCVRQCEDYGDVGL